MKARAWLQEFDFFQKLCTLPYVKQIILYGSRARGDDKERSDIDLAIDCGSSNLSEWVKITDIIENADTLLKIDCVRLDTLNKESSLFHAIKDQGVIVYKRDDS